MADHPMDLTGRTILVTGASSGIGRETAVLLSRLNARVVLAGRNRERLDAAASRLQGDGHVVQPFDLCAAGEIPSWLRNLAAQSGPLAGAVHCAGIHNAHPLRILTADKIEEVMRLNLTSAAMLAKGLRQKGCYTPGASLVFLSSAAGLVGEAGVSAYAASKAALIGLTRSLAMELAAQQIRVNCVAPGIVRSEMSEQLQKSLTAEQFAALETKHPLGLGTPGDIANSIAFLLADTARWITGATLVVDGGYTAH
jgi:NAD(P)-dependent dehydrogenase (short-subunit alcohol dehydrogenase family)